MKDIKYELKDITPESMRCVGVASACPALYEVVRMENCVVGGCPSIYGTAEKPDTYFVIGKKIEPKEAGLADKVGADEGVIAIPKGLLERLKEQK